MEAPQVDILKERIKELSCLYDISTLASDYSNSLPKTLQAIAERLAVAWRHSDDAIAEIKVDENIYASGKLPAKAVSSTQPIFIDDEIIGFIKVHYPSPKYVESDFLPEENQLLKKLTHEVSNIVERHQRSEKEELLKRSAERSDRLSILGEITAGIAHELNTPLGNILGFSELISEKTKENQVKLDAEKITASAMHAREVVKKLMFFSCEMPQQREPTPINPLVEDAIKLLQPSLDSAGINLVFTPDSNNACGRLDPIQITQIIFNMVINASHASKPGSTISVSILSTDKKLNLIIADEGYGIPEELQSKIFEPFFTTKDVGEGSGLGLSVVHGIVKSHGGSIRFSSEQGKGTTFNVSLPI